MPQPVASQEASPAARINEAAPVLLTMPSVGLTIHRGGDLQPSPAPSTSVKSNVILPASSQILGSHERLVVLELEDSSVYQGYSFGAEKNVAGELVFQTGMVGYPESITDPSYRGQILVITFPLVGNYGVPSRETEDELLKGLPKHFESTQIHVAALVVATYSGEDYSHFLAQSSLAQWLKEQGVPAMYGVDTRALTKRIREEGSMLGRVMLEKLDGRNGVTNGVAQNGNVGGLETEGWRSCFEHTEWVDPNKKNLVAEGEFCLQPDLNHEGSCC
jgi:carbamoyl-phosphate synthase / aspartate carbamoyltransferase